MEITRKSTINASADHVWKLLGPGFADIGEWFSGVLRSDAVPAEESSEGAACDVSGRVCVVPQGRLSERITHYDDKAQTFSFVIDSGLPGFVLEAGNTFQVRSLDDGTSELSFHAKLKLSPVANALMGWLFRRKVNETADQIISDFKVYAETGKVSDRKKLSQNRYAKKASAQTVSATA